MGLCTRLSVGMSLLLPVLSPWAARGATPEMAGPNVQDTRLLQQPAVSAGRIAFIYANDLWTCDLDGRNVKRLTASLGAKSSPAFSPDGRWIAFSAQHAGNIDAYVVATEGGVPRRLTWHPGADVVQGFTPDGKSVLFTSPRAVYTTRYTQLFTVPVEGGPEEQLSIPHANRAVYSPDGSRLAYSPLSPPFLQWKRYRGGQASQIWLFDVKTHRIEKIPQPESRANDAGPMWMGDTIYFRSDRDGEFNLYAFNTKSKAIRRLTDHADFPILNASSGGGHIVYEQAGYLHLFDPTTGMTKKLTIGVAADLQEARERFVKGAKYIREFSLSPSGMRAAFNFRGEIVTVPADKGDVRNLTNSPGAHERSPIWSPDGRSVAYFSDASGEWKLEVRSQDGKGEAKVIKLTGAGFYDRPAWSPDSKRIVYCDNARAIYWLDLATGVAKKVASDYVYGPEDSLRPRWSPDSKWIAYSVNNQSYIQRVFVYSLDQGRSFPVTDGLSDASDPVFDRSGKYLYFFASTDSGPVNNWFSLENQDLTVSRAIYMAVLRKDLPSPLVKESDEEKPAASSEEPKAGQVAAADEKEKESNAEAAESDEKSDEPHKAPAKIEPVKIDVDGINYRILSLPIPAADMSNLQTGTNGQVFFLRKADDKTELKRFDLKDRKTEALLHEVDDYEISADGKKVLYQHKDDWAIAHLGAKVDASQGKLKVDAIEVKIDPRAEWPEMFEDAWRINRDYFYDPHMHGLDWGAIRTKYAQFLPDLTVRDDLNRVIRWMLSELSVGHSYITSAGDAFAEEKVLPGGLLGADYTIDQGRYRFAKVYGGLNWNPDLRSPLTEPGVNVKAGEYLLAVGGRDVRPPANLYSFFENTAGKLIEITVGPSPDGKGKRTVTVVPIESELQLRNRDWVEGNLRRVEEATGGRVAYVYVPNTAALGYTYFRRYFYPQSYKDAVILDERHNGGGSVADYYIDVLQKKLIAWWTFRYGPDMKTPSASVQGPKVMLADATAGSGGDLLPWMFRKFQVGEIIGTRTWGGLIGILGTPVLMDGGSITAPNLAFRDPEKGWSVENEGVPPDIEVEDTPAELIAGHDPQLERAIQVVMEELKKNPPPEYKRPPFPIKAVGGTTATTRPPS
jgi:tricorn protease